MLLAHLPRYVQHLRRHPHSLLARLLGTPLGAGPKPQSAWRGGVCGRGGSWDGSKVADLGLEYFGVEQH